MQTLAETIRAWFPPVGPAELAYLPRSTSAVMLPLAWRLTLEQVCFAAGDNCGGIVVTINGTLEGFVEERQEETVYYSRFSTHPVSLRLDLANENDLWDLHIFASALRARLLAEEGIVATPQAAPGLAVLGNFERLEVAS